jgi:hypothetical protein
VGDEDQSPPAYVDESDVDFWGDCLLTRILTDPPQYDLRLPDGKSLRLRTSHFFNVAAFTIAWVDATGTFPPLPQKKPGPFLQDVFRRLLEDRRETMMPAEASARGTLADDIRSAILACPQTDDPNDIPRGSLFLAPDGTGAWLSSRSLLARVGRACPVKFTPADFYLGIVEAGLVDLGKLRHIGWQGRAWLVPHNLLPAMAEPEAAPIPALPEPEPQRGFFDDMLDA